MAIVSYSALIKYSISTHSNELNSGTSEVVQHLRFYGGVHIGASALLDINLIRYGLAISLAYFSVEEGCLLVQLFLPALALLRGKGVSTLW